MLREALINFYVSKVVILMRNVGLRKAVVVYKTSVCVAWFALGCPCVRNSLKI